MSGQAPGQITLRGMPRRRRFCPARDCTIRCGAIDIKCLCDPCDCPACSRRAERAKTSRLGSVRPLATITFKQPHLQPALFAQRPERTFR